MITNKFSVLLILLFYLISFPAVYAQDNDKSDYQNAVIEDELLKSKHFRKKIKPVKIKDNTPITDELINTVPNDGSSVFKLEVFQQGKFEELQIDDELISPEFIKNASNVIIIKKDKPDDYFIEKNIDLTNVRHIKAKTKYDFTKKQIPIKIKISKHLKSTKGMLEGSTIPFVAVHDFVINGRKFKKGTEILGRVETISDSDKMGVPECIRIDNFYIDEENDINFHGSVSKTGANRSIWVYPLYQAGNICFYVAGFVFVPIHGGRAKLMTTETFTVFYETQ